MKPIATFSIVGFDAQKKEWGVAVQSKFMAVGSVASWAKAGAGAVATQSYANLMYGPWGLEHMAAGRSAQSTIDFLVSNDEDRDLRQVGMVDASGQTASFTGEKCHAWAGHVVGDGYACQGNILVPGTVEAMSARFEAVRGKQGELADWLVAALAAGQKAGGDKRGRQSAAVLVVREAGGYGGNNDRYLDLRVDDHPAPIKELERLLKMHHLYFGEVDQSTVVPLMRVATELQKILYSTGHYHGPIHGDFDQRTREALRSLVGIENLEERWTGKEDVIDAGVLAYLREKFGGRG
ncbi:MAG: DUF1028 domain-containing protein [Anaerolineaceae bacterium]|nr:DUF1028 domain-containing protein [Anaerolineaceae bacterium]